MWTVLPRRACMQESRVHLPVIQILLLFQVNFFIISSSYILKLKIWYVRKPWIQIWFAGVSSDGQGGASSCPAPSLTACPGAPPSNCWSPGRTDTGESFSYLVAWNCWTSSLLVSSIVFFFKVVLEPLSLSCLVHWYLKNIKYQI